MDEQTIARFWSHVDKSAGPDGCWLWTASKGSTGYGQFNPGLARGRRMMKTHRAAWELTHGPIPSGEGYHGTCVCHRCDTPTCVNPAHLFLGTQTDNNRDKCAKGRAKGGSSPGERNPSAKLTEEDARLAIRLLSEGVRYRDIASRFGVSIAAIGYIASGKNWAHLPR